MPRNAQRATAATNPSAANRVGGVEPGWAATASRGALRGATGAREIRGRRSDAERAARATKSRGALNGSLRDVAGNTTVDTMTSDRTSTGAGTAGAIGRRPRIAIPARFIDSDKGVAVAAGATVAGVDGVLAGASAGVGGGSSVGSAGGASVVPAGGGDGGGLAGGTGSITVTVVWLVASCTCVAS